MAKYNVTHSCGHVERVDLIGPHRSREWRIERMQTERCQDCRHEELQRQNAQAAEENRAAELPALIGTEKQIAWAETLRARILNGVQAIIQGAEMSSERLRQNPDLPAAFERLCAETRAFWWIDSRDIGLHLLIRQMLEVVRNRSARQDEAQSGIEAKAEATVRPAVPKTETVAEIRTIGSAIEVRFPELHEDFRLLMHDLRYRWKETVWKREIGPFNGTVADRTAEAGHQLLAAGFPVRIYDESLRAKAIAGEFEPEAQRWVKKAVGDSPHAGWFVISWPRGEDFYRAAKRIAGSRYGKGGVYVPPEQFEQVLDFAERYQFSLSPGAEQLVNAARSAREKVLVVSVSLPQREVSIEVAGRVPPMLAVPDEVAIDDSLRDDN